ncbi:MAG: nucleotide exchange factor GrpE [Ruminococcus sp.]|nr:nucleotide exchange factor GrpE [Ruminococcus sp.]
MSKKNENLTPEENTEVSEEVAEIPAEPSECEKLTEELKTQKENYLRLAAEYDNYRKRTQQEKLSIYADATAKAIEELLPMADSIAAALASTPEGDPQRQGIELIGNQFAKSLEKLGVESFGEVGEPFDPQLHNGVARTENPDLPENSIAMVFQKGFKIGDKIIRAAMVQVANCG